MCFRFHKKPKAVQTVKLTLHYRAETLVSRYEEVDPSNEPNRPHISSVSINFKERRDKSDWMRPNLFGAPRLIYLCFLFASRTVRPAWRSRLAPSAPPVKGYLRRVAGVRKCFFEKNDIFLQKSRFFFIFIWLWKQLFVDPGSRRNFIS